MSDNGNDSGTLLPGIASAALEFLTEAVKSHPTFVIGGFFLLVIIGLAVFAKFKFEQLRRNDSYRRREQLIRMRAEESEYQQRVQMLKVIVLDAPPNLRKPDSAELDQSIVAEIPSDRRSGYTDRRITFERRVSVDPVEVERRSGRDRRMGKKDRRIIKGSANA